MGKYDLLLEIRVPRSKGEGYGTGYPVAENRILTARHLVCPPDRDKSKPIKVQWHYYKTGFAEGRVIWHGEGDVDAAILECVFPQEARDWRPVSASLPQSGTPWASEGFARAGEQQDGRREPVSLQGKVYGMAEAAATFTVDVNAPVETVDYWPGVSGSPVFVGDAVIGVIATVPGNFHAKQLKAVPTWKLIRDDEGFRRAIGLDESQERKLHKEILEEMVRNAIRTSSRALAELCPRLGVDAVGEDARAAVLADALLTKCRIENLLPTAKIAFRSLSDRGESDAAKAIREMLHIVVPAIFEIAWVDAMRARKSDVRFAMLECPFSTKTVAEVIMAGADGRKALFARPRQSGDLPHGDYLLRKEPEPGLDVRASLFKEDFRDHLINMFAPDIAPDKRLTIGPSRVTRRLSKWEKEKTYYFIVDLPEDQADVARINEVIAELKTTYPHIAFLMLNTTDDDLYLRETDLFDPLIDMILSDVG